jgi:hypothetical protein
LGLGRSDPFGNASLRGGRAVVDSFWADGTCYLRRITQLSLLLAMQHAFRHYCGSDAKRAAETAKGKIISSIINT